jgi:hypothetical protein
VAVSVGLEMYTVEVRKRVEVFLMVVLMTVVALPEP